MVDTKPVGAGFVLTGHLVQSNCMTTPYKTTKPFMDGAIQF